MAYHLGYAILPMCFSKAFTRRVDALLAGVQRHWGIYLLFKALCSPLLATNRELFQRVESSFEFRFALMYNQDGMPWPL